MAAVNVANNQLDSQVYPFQVSEDGTRPKNVGIRECTIHAFTHNVFSLFPSVSVWYALPTQWHTPVNALHSRSYLSHYRPAIF